MERIRQIFEPQSIYELLLRPLHHPKINFLDHAMEGLVKNLTEDELKYASQQILYSFDNERFFSRRKLEFELLRSHISTVNQAKKKKQNIHLVEIPPPHFFSDMRGFNLEPEKPGAVDYSSKPNYVPAGISTGRGVRSSLNQFPLPNVGGDSELNIVLESDREVTPRNNSPISMNKFNAAIRAISDTTNVRSPTFEIQVLPPPYFERDMGDYKEQDSHQDIIGEVHDHGSLDFRSINVSMPVVPDLQSLKSPYSQGLQKDEQISVSNLQILRTYVKESISQSENKLEKVQESSLNLANVDFENFLEKFLGNSREYTFQNWNHFSKRGQLKFEHTTLKRKRDVSDMDFTEVEKEWKKYADNIPVEHLTRSACLEYQYSPEYCFNSMIDVIDMQPVLLKSSARNRPALDPTKQMIYNPRVFNDPHDSLYQQGEFPPSKPEVQNPTASLRLHTQSFAEDSSSRSLQFKQLKNEMFNTSQTLLRKGFLPIKSSDVNKFNQTLKAHAGDDEYLKRRKKTSRRASEVEYKEAGHLTAISDRFLVDYVELDIKHSSMSALQETKLEAPKPEIESSSSNESDDLEPEEWYEGVIDQERPRPEITQLNWSGEQVVPYSKYTRHRMEVTIDSLNIQDIDIWLGGVLGLSKTIRKYIRKIIGHRYTDRALMVFVLLNTIILTLDGIVDDNTNKFLTNFNTYFTLIFLVAYLLSLWGYGWSFLKSYFNIFDGAVIVVSMVELVINFSEDNVTGGSAVSAFRALRILRIFKVLRLTRILRSLKFILVIITVITETVEQYLYVAIMLLLFLLIYALLGMQIYGGKLPPQNIIPRANYDTFISSFLTVLQLVTFENWTDHIVLLYNSGVSKAITLVFIISWLIIGNYIFLNLFLALLLGGFESEEVINSLHETKDEYKELKERIQKINLEQKKLLKDLDDKRVSESRNISYIINTDIKQQIYEEEAMFDVLSADKVKNRGTYFLERPFKHDESSLDGLLYETLEERTNSTLLRQKSTIKKREIYLDVYCEASMYAFLRQHPIRKFAATVVSHSLFEPIIQFLIFTSSAKLVVETYIPADTDPTLSLGFTIFDNILTVIFVFEAIVKIIRNGLFQCKNSYFQDPWSILDFVIVVASFVDMILASVSIPMIKIVRALRPLRFIAKYRHMKIVVNSLARIVVPLLNVIIVIVIVWLIFGILGINFAGGKLGYCDINFYFDVSKEVCIANGFTWKRAYWNFDNIGESMVTLFVLSTLEGWPNIVVSALDAGDNETSGPHYNNYPYMWFYFMAFIFVSSFFLIDLMIGIIFFHYGEELEKSISSDTIAATPDQVKWILTQKLIFSAKSNFKILKYPKSKIRRFFFIIMTSRIYELVMFVAILMNIVILGMDYHGMSETYERTLDLLSDVFSWLFLAELVFKLIAHSKYYFKDRWNIFDCFIALLSMADVLIGLFLQSATNGGYQRIQFAKGLRVIRVVRLIKLFKNPQMAAFNKLIGTLIFSLPTISNVLALLFLTYSIFAVIACFIFQNPKNVNPTYYNPNVNFDNYHMALLTLFRCSTGEDWPSVMYSYGDSPGNYTASRLFFIIFIFIISIIMLNLLDLVVVSIFENFYFDPHNVLTQFDQITKTFNEAWNAFTMKTKGEKIHYLTLPRFFATLQEPLGFRVNEEEAHDPSIHSLITEQKKFFVRRPIMTISMLLGISDLPM
jgi:hypothetical protein